MFSTTHKTRHGWIAAATLTGLATASVVLALPAAAQSPVSQSRGRFLTGQIGGTSLDTIAAIQGEQAANYGGADVLHYNSLDASALDGAIKLPLTGALQLPGGNVLHLGAVNQIARASGDGSALGASGAVNNSGGVAVGGSNTVPPADASLDLSGLGGSSVASTLGNLKLTIGALSAIADQAGGTNGAQTGKYNIAGLSLDLTSPALANVTGPLVSTLTTTAQSLASQLNSSPLGAVVTVTGANNFPDAATTLTTLDLANGAITASLTTGAIHIDVAALLKSLGLDLNNLPPNTHLLPYLTQALSTALPAGVASLLSGLQTKYLAAFSGLGFTIAGVPVNSSQLAVLTPILNTLSGQLTSALTSAGSQFSSAAFGPLASAFGSNLDLIVNGQATNGGTFTEQALQLNLGSGTAGAQIALATASVGPGTPATTPSSIDNPPAPTTNPTTPAGRSTIKIDAGGGTAPHGPNPWLAALGVVLIVSAGAGTYRLRVQRATAGQDDRSV